MRYLVDEHGNVVFLKESGTRARVGQQYQHSLREQVKCPYCPSRVRRSRLARHLRGVHAASASEIEALERQFPHSVSEISPSHVGDQTRQSGTPSKPASGRGSFATDGQDGSKHIGQFAREQGRFGTMPQHDDYSEDGTPD